jgi:hypothetical protein
MKEGRESKRGEKEVRNGQFLLFGRGEKELRLSTMVGFKPQTNGLNATMVSLN